MGGCLFTQSHADQVIGLQDERSLMNSMKANGNVWPLHLLQKAGAVCSI